MATIERFEEIEAWKEARKLTEEIYRISKKGGFNRDPGLRDQLRRASVSGMANIAEGFDGGSPREFQRFLLYALRSVSEVQSHLYVALDQDYLGSDVFKLLYDRTLAVKSLIGGFLRYLRSASRANRKERMTFRTPEARPEKLDGSR
jgi:four helix bundle protein